MSSKIKLNSLSQHGRGKNLFLLNDFCITVFFFFFNLFQLKLKQINSEHALKGHLIGPETFAHFL